ncbi:MAG: lipase maturation factor family protein [Balneolaceae bacterium]|nr:lipase maturation factor family protein [Balneolaceae bacterium]
MIEFIGGLYQADYWFAKFLFQRALGVVYLIAFINALNQFIPLLGEDGLLPVPQFLNRMSFSKKPSLFHWHYSDRLLKVVAWTGILLSLSIISGVALRGPFWISMLIWILLWGLYMSIVNIGVIFYSFGWESMLLEAGFYAIFLGPLQWTAPVLVIWMLRWMLFRVEFGAGLIKMRGDPCWRELTCLNYHHETQPQPNPLSWFFHQLPEPLHKTETFFNHVVQLGVVWGLFLPQPIASIAASLIILSQAYLIISGNYSWLNWLTIILAVSGFSDGVIRQVFGFMPEAHSAVPLPFTILVGILALIIIYLSIGPVKNMLSSHQKMNFSFNPIHLVNTYGAFGSVTKKRYEIVIEGTSDEEIDEDTEWREYEFKGKPGDPTRRPPLVSPYHLRLDWQMWFAAMSRSYRRHPWFEPLIAKLLANDPNVIGLLKDNPFPEEPPQYIRAQMYLYRFTGFRELRKTGQWWKREYQHEYMAPRSLNQAGP